MSPETEGHAAALHVAAYLHNLLLFAEVDNVNGEVHSEGVNGFTRNNPKAFSGRKGHPFQQAAAARFARPGDVGMGCQDVSAGEVFQYEFLCQDAICSVRHASTAAAGEGLELKFGT